MIWRIILWGSLIWLPYLMYRVLGGEAKFTKNIVVGVTMPFEAHEDAEVCRRLAKFKKELGIVCAVLTAAVVPCVFIRSVSLSMTLYLTWADVCIVIPYIPYLRCNRDLKRIKRSRGCVPCLLPLGVPPPRGACGRGHRPHQYPHAHSPPQLGADMAGCGIRACAREPRGVAVGRQSGPVAAWNFARVGDSCHRGAAHRV